MNTSKIFFAAALFVAFEGVLCAGEAVSPARIISLGSAVTENIYLLGAEERLVANTAYCVRPPEAKDKQKIGSIVQADMEKILMLKPDMVIATALTKKEQLAKLRSLGINVKVFPEARNFAEFCGAFIELGSWVGLEDKARVTVNDLKEKVNAFKLKTAARKKRSVFVQIGSRPLFAATKEHLLDDLINFAGGRNIASDAGRGIFSYEKVYEADPDVIVIVEMGVSGEREKKLWESSGKIKAAKTKRIYVVDSYKFCSPTPETFLEALGELEGYLSF